MAPRWTDKTTHADSAPPSSPSLASACRDEPDEKTEPICHRGQNPPLPLRPKTFFVLPLVEQITGSPGLTDDTPDVLGRDLVEIVKRNPSTCPRTCPRGSETIPTHPPRAKMDP